MGTTGQVGGYALKHLHEAKANVRAILRNDTKSATIRAAGILLNTNTCERQHRYRIVHGFVLLTDFTIGATSIAIGDVSDSKSLATAFSGAEGVYVMLPPNPDPAPGFATERSYIDAIITGILNASPRPKRVVMVPT